MSLYDDAKTRVKVGSAYSEEFEVKVGVHQGSVLWPLLVAIVADAITEKARRAKVVLISEIMEDLKILESEGCNGR